MKICRICKKEKDMQKNGKCRECNNEYMTQYRAKNSDKIKKYQKEYDIQYYRENKEDVLAYKKIYYRENKEDILQDRKEYYEENKEKIQEYNKQYYIDNKEKFIQNAKNYYKDNKNNVRKHHNKYYKNKRLNNKNFRIRSAVSASINFYLKSNNSSKNGKSCLDYLQYSIDELKTYLESKFEPWMNWGNYGKYNVKTWNDIDKSTWTWQIDHIIPQSKFLYTSMNDSNFKLCWSLDNLRPLSSKQNFIDGVTRVRHK